MLSGCVHPSAIGLRANARLCASVIGAVDVVISSAAMGIAVSELSCTWTISIWITPEL
jgi:hypothetical protein